MKLYALWLPIILIFSVFQAAVWQVNLVLLMIAALLIVAMADRDQRTEPKIFWLIFWSGLIFDLAQGRTLGISSLVYLIISFLFRLYSQRFDVSRPFFMAGFVLVTNLAYQRLVWGNWLWWPSLALAVLIVLLRPIILFLKDQGRLKLNYRTY